MKESNKRAITFTKARNRMVEEQIIGRGIQDKAVQEAFRTIPRHLFVPPQYRNEAYADYPLPIGYGQTISQPFIVALMTEKAKLCQTDCVLEVGTGSGYQAAILSCLCKRVDTVERIPDLCAKAEDTLRELGIQNVAIHQADGTCGWLESAPYDAIIVTACSPEVPPPLKEQLKKGGRMVIPVGNSWSQELQLWIKTEMGFEMEEIIPVVFVPLLGKWGWQESHYYRNELD